MKPKTSVQGSITNFERKETKGKLLHSNFYLTINLNQSYKEDDPHIKNDSEMFDSVLNDILNHIEHYVKLPDGDAWNEDLIDRCDIQYAVEMGGKKRQLHAHVLLKVTHRSKVLLDYTAIKKRICDELGLKNIYMMNRLVKRTSDDNILDYINKMNY